MVMEIQNKERVGGGGEGGLHQGHCLGKEDQRPRGLAASASSK